jgi:hypothetical protein
MYQIKAIYEKDYITPKESHQFRVGRTGEIYGIQIGYPLFFMYNELKCLKTSPVESVDVDENDVVVVETENTIYEFEIFREDV